MRNLSDKYGDLATAMEDAAPSIAGAISALRGARGDAADAGYVLRTGDREYSVDFDKKSARGDVEFDQQTANDWHRRLKSLGEAADQAVGAASSSIQSGLDSIADLTPASIAQNSRSIDPAKAAADARAILTGTASPEQRARFLRGMSLTPAQLAKLNAGEAIELSTDQMKYMRQAAGAVDVGSGEVKGPQAFREFGTQPGDHELRSALANGLRVISNENVHSESGNGNFAMLPQSMKNSLTRPDLVSQRGPITSMNGVADNSAIGKLLKDGDSRYAAGSALDSRLLEVGRQYTNAQAHYEQDLGVTHTADGAPAPGARTLFVDGAIRYDDSGMPRLHSATAAGDIQDVVTAGAMDKVSLRDALAGPNGQDYIHDLLTTKWPDKGAIAGAVFETAPDAAHVDDPSDRVDVHLSRLTGETMHEVAKYAHTHEGWLALKDIPNTDGQSVGQVNPKLLETLARSMSPYADDLAGKQDNSLLGFNADDVRHSPGKPGDFEGASRIYALFGGSDESAKVFYGQAIQDLQHAADEYGQQLGSGSDGNAAEKISLLGHLRGLIDEGIAYSSDDAAGSAYEAAHNAWQTKKGLFEGVLKLGEPTLDTIPRPGAEVANAVKDSLVQTLIGKEPTAAGFDPKDFAPDFNPTGPDTQDMAAIRRLIADSIPGDTESELDPAFVGAHEDWFHADGRLKSIDEIAAIQNEFGEPKYGEQKITSGLETVVHQLADRSGNSDESKLEAKRDEVTREAPELSDRWPR
ncbi:TPR repeat region-containing protein [Gordonia soli]|nr:hypothetical protein [Gordonia soli]